MTTHRCLHTTRAGATDLQDSLVVHQTPVHQWVPAHPAVHTYGTRKSKYVCKAHITHQTRNSHNFLTFTSGQTYLHTYLLPVSPYALSTLLSLCLLQLLLGRSDPFSLGTLYSPFPPASPKRGRRMPGKGEVSVNVLYCNTILVGNLKTKRDKIRTNFLCQIPN